MQEKKQIFSPVKQRILQFVETLHISKREFCSKTGISRGTLESPTGINEETLAKVIATYSNVSPTWLITGNGVMILENNATTVTVDLTNINDPYCKSCKEKDRTIVAMEKALTNLEKVNDNLEKELTECKRQSAHPNDSYKQTGT